ncbi:hypothetical protein SAMN05216330_112148 [Bradyrhizobium sp. Ghvi]|uniref:hypothetical protein n=1 Tax=Bradyrhizobium sp. Ghvi TaxID=1855319 RepID=UPI0008F05D3D|nr:hypothetical protein [Bradyrhizobium sp. Ghvi]SFP94975.1 hypothetical protein SAMN05216330_112148 [Bradyrhizobium sp. Ghvi]
MNDVLDRARNILANRKAQEREYAQWRAGHEDHEFYAPLPTMRRKDAPRSALVYKTHDNPPPEDKDWKFVGDWERLNFELRDVSKLLFEIETGLIRRQDDAVTALRIEIATLREDVFAAIDDLRAEIATLADDVVDRSGASITWLKRSRDAG